MSSDATAARLQEVGMEPAILFLWLTISFELVAGFVLAIGARFAWIAALALAAFTLATNALFHQFWELDGQIGALELSLFFKNVSIAGALIALAIVERAGFGRDSGS